MLPFRWINGIEPNKLAFPNIHKWCPSDILFIVQCQLQDCYNNIPHSQSSTVIMTTSIIQIFMDKHVTWCVCTIFWSWEKLYHCKAPSMILGLHNCYPLIFKKFHLTNKINNLLSKFLLTFDLFTSQTAQHFASSTDAAMWCDTHT